MSYVDRNPFPDYRDPVTGEYLPMSHAMQQQESRIQKAERESQALERQSTEQLSSMLTSIFK